MYPYLDLKFKSDLIEEPLSFKTFFILSVHIFGY